MEVKNIESSRICICSTDAGSPTEKNKNEARVSAESNYSQLFKNTSRTVEASIQSRRAMFLQEHKGKHDDQFDRNRELTELFEEREISASETEEEPMDMESAVRVRKKKKIKFTMTRTEWFTQVPEDFSVNWLVKFCPEGKRRLIVSNSRTTKAFNKFGQLISQFVSHLPGGGGSKLYSCQKPGLTVLDCVFNEPTRTFFILDMLVWNSTSFLDCDAELRHCWIRTKYMDCPEYFEEYGKNSFKFKVIVDYPADANTIESELSQFDEKCGVSCEGILFYHKEAPYITMTTPLVTWLKPYMLVDALNIKIPSYYENKKPQSYVNLASHLEKIAKSGKRRNGCWGRRQNSKSENMETSLMEIPTMETLTEETSTMEIAT